MTQVCNLFTIVAFGFAMWCFGYGFAERRFQTGVQVAPFYTADPYDYSKGDWHAFHEPYSYDI